MKALALVAALGVALYGCTASQQTVEVPPAPTPAPPAAPAAPPQPVQEPGIWRITKTEWSAADEKGFGDFVRRIAESDCMTTIACMQSAANIYHDSDPPSFLFHADCAKWVYMLRAYYASKNGLPFSYVDRVAGDNPDLRFSKTSNQALERRDIVDNGAGIDTLGVLHTLHDEVSTATYRIDPAAQLPVQQDFYSPKIQPGSIHAGTAIYDINGHVMIVYQVAGDGSILYLDANPDEHVTRGFYGPQVPEDPQALGGGFKNFRPLSLVGAQQLPDGSYLGGHVVLAANEGIPDFSLEQYQGNVADDKSGDGAKYGSRAAQYRYNNVSLGFYEYVRAAMSNGGFAFNPVYELEVTMGAVCGDAKAGTKEADARVKSALAVLYADLSTMETQWKARDLRVVYHGPSFKSTLADTYAAEAHACTMAKPGDSAADATAASAFDRFADGPAETNVSGLITKIDDDAPLPPMRPVGN